jgi:hypothetical protein
MGVCMASTASSVYTNDRNGQIKLLMISPMTIPMSVIGLTCVAAFRIIRAISLIDLWIPQYSIELTLKKEGLPGLKTLET